MSQVNLDVDIEFDTTAGKYKATVSDPKAHAKKLAVVRWTFKRKDGFPANAKVIIQFVDQSIPPKSAVDGPMLDGAGRYSTTGKHLSGLISPFAKASYYYTISYDDNGTVKELLDPEIIVDGNAIVFERFLKGLRLALKALQQRDRLKAAKAAKRPGKKR